MAQNDTPTQQLDITSPPDVVALLYGSLPTGWEVEREIDPDGDISIIVLSAIDDPVPPTFILYERDGQAMVATIRDDIWETARTFTNCQRAVAAITRMASSVEAATGRQSAPTTVRVEAVLPAVPALGWTGEIDDAPRQTGGV